MRMGCGPARGPAGKRRPAGAAAGQMGAMLAQACAARSILIRQSVATQKEGGFLTCKTSI